MHRCKKPLIQTIQGSMKETIHLFTDISTTYKVEKATADLKELVITNMHTHVHTHAYRDGIGEESKHYI